MPCAKNAFSLSELKLSNGRTAMLLSEAAGAAAVCDAGIVDVAFVDLTAGSREKNQIAPPTIKRAMIAKSGIFKRDFDFAAEASAATGTLANFSGNAAFPASSV